MNCNGGGANEDQSIRSNESLMSVVAAAMAADASRVADAMVADAQQWLMLWLLMSTVAYAMDGDTNNGLCYGC